MLACADIEEGIALRQAGVRAPILVFGALSVSDLDGIFDARPDADDLDARRRARAAGRRGEARRPAVLSSEDRHRDESARLPARQPRTHAARSRRDSPNLAIAAVYTHFATADDPDHPAFALQQERFDAGVGAVAVAGDRDPRASRRQQRRAAPRRARLARLRPAGPAALWNRAAAAGVDTRLRPALSLHSRIVAVKGLRPGEGTGYGLRTAVEGATTLAVIPAGYADGIDLRLAGRGYMLVRGRRAPVVGSVCMDMTTIDVTGMDVAPGDEVVIIGEQGEESIGVREIAAAIGTIPYELLCRLGSRIQRVYRVSQIPVQLQSQPLQIPVTHSQLPIAN